MKTVADQTNHLSRYALERIQCGDIELEGNPDHQAHVQGCPRCSEYLTRAPEQASQLLEQYPSFERLHGAYATRRSSLAGVTVSPVWQWLDAIWLKPALAAVMVCLVVIGVALMQRTPAPALAVKGDVSFSLYVNGSPAGRDGLAVTCLPGDTLQLVVSSPEPVYCWVLYRDDDSEVKMYMPQAHEQPRAIGQTGGARLPHAIVLDSQWREEQLFCVWAAQPRSRAQVEKFVRQASVDPGRHLADETLRMQTFTLRSGAK